MYLLLHDVGNFWCSKHLSQTSMGTLSRPGPAQPLYIFLNETLMNFIGHVDKVNAPCRKF